MTPSTLRAVSKSPDVRMQPSKPALRVGGRSMRTLQLIRRQSSSEFQADRYENEFAETRDRKSETPNLSEFPMPGLSALSSSDFRTPVGSEGFFKDL